MKLILCFISLFENIVTFIVYVSARHKFDKSRYRFNFTEVWFSPWINDKEFNAIYAKVAENTLVSKRKLYDLFLVGRQVHSLPGDILEIGSWRGGSAALLASVLPEKNIVLWDNWGSLVNKDSYFIEKEYSTNDDIAKAKLLLARVVPEAEKRCCFIEMVFPGDIAEADLAPCFSLIHFDVYDDQAFVDGAEMLWSRLSTGGVFVVGGYGAISLDHLTIEVDEFVCKHDCLFIQAQSGIGLIIKSGSSPKRVAKK